MPTRSTDARAIISGAGAVQIRTLAAKERWLVLTKTDLLPADEAKARAADIARRLRHKGPKFLISGATGVGTKELCEAIMTAVEEAGRKDFLDDEA
jgi:GTPase